MVVEDPKSSPASGVVREATLPVGTVVAEQYRVQSGGTESVLGRVYRAMQLSQDRVVAVKVLGVARALGASLQVWFEHQGAVLKRVDHPHMVQLLDFGVTDTGLGFIVTEYLVGRTLKEVLEANTRPQPHECARSIGQLLSALSALHEAGIVHGNLRPQSIVLTIRPSASGELLETVKLNDFEMSRMLGSHHATESAGLGDGYDDAGEDGAWGQQSVDLLVSAPEYLSPEQCEAQPLDGRSDLYAAGVLLYQLLTGALPFTAPSAVEMILQQLRGAAPAPSTLVPGIPATLDAIVLRALEKDPAKRYATAREMAAAIDEFLVTQPPRSGKALLPAPEGSLAGARTTGVSGTMGAVAQPTAVQPALAATQAASEPPVRDRRGRIGVRTKLGTPSPVAEGSALPPAEVPEVDSTGELPAMPSIPPAVALDVKPTSVRPGEEVRTSFVRVVGEGQAAPAPRGGGQRTKLGVGDEGRVPEALQASAGDKPSEEEPKRKLRRPRMLLTNPEFLAAIGPDPRTSETRVRVALIVGVVLVALLTVVGVAVRRSRASRAVEAPAQTH